MDIQKLKNAKIGIAGAGGLGSNIAIALARIGVGNLIVADFDVVNKSNLNRQYYFTDQLGVKKVYALKQNILRANPDINVEPIDILLDESNICNIFKDVDIIVEAFDNPKYKAIIVNTVLSNMDKKIVACSGIGGYYSSNSIITKKINERFYLVGDGLSEVCEDVMPLAPRVGIAAHHQANMVLRLILGEDV